MLIRSMALAFAALLLVATPVAASGLQTHLWIAQRIIDELKTGCDVSIAGRAFALPADTCESIRAHPGAFLAGSLGPDAFPDLVTGQVTTHPGVKGDWQTKHWLEHLYKSAAPGEELAFAAGYLVHAASDTFAHSYVNAYAGDIFELGDERAVERRHFVLEKYIDYRLPTGEPDPGSMTVPAEFLAKKLILDASAARVSAKSGFGGHIATMQGIYTGVSALAEGLDDLEGDVGDALGTLVAKQLELGGKLATGEAQLEVAGAALKIEEERLKLQQKALDEASKGLDLAIDALERNRKHILLSDERARLAREGIKAAKNAASEATNAINSYEKSLLNLENQIANTPAQICNEVAGWCKKICPFCGFLCEPAKWVCKPSEAFGNLVSEKNKVLSRISDEKAKLAKSGVDLAARTAEEAQALQEKTEAEALTAGLDATKVAKQVAYNGVKATFDAQLEITKEARSKVDDLRAELAKLRQALLDTDKLKAYVSSLVAHSDILSGYAKNWKKGIEVASAEYIRTGLRVSQNLVRKESGVFTEYSRWLSCYGGAFTPVPYQAGQWVCEAKSAYEQMQSEFDKFVAETLPPPLDELYKEYVDLKARFEQEIRKEVNKAGLELVKLAAPDATTADFIDLLTNPEGATAGKLDEVFAEVGDAGGKKLLVFPKVSDLINTDIGLVGGRVDPQKFVALRHAESFSRLALLGEPSLRRVVWRLGGDADLPLAAAGTRYSVLFETLRSIDGNQQWQPYGLPYARTSGAPDPVDAQERHYGYGPLDADAKGLPIFIDDDLRRMVFLQIFPKGISGELRKVPELGPGAYPFAECAGNPFPVAFLPGGAPSQADTTCADGDAAVTARFGDQLTRFWRTILDALGLEPRASRRGPVETRP